MQIMLMSFNTQSCKNYLEQKTDIDVMVKAIEKCSAEIIGLQEMYEQNGEGSFGRQTKLLAEKLGYEHYYFAKAITVGNGNGYGNGLISKYPILTAETVLIPKPEVRGYDGYYEDRCLLKATLDVNGIMLNVLVIHFGLNPDEAENAVRAVVANLPEENTVLMGDFNLTPDSELLRPIRERLFDTAALFTDATAPANAKLSFPSDAPRVKIDYILTTPDVKVLCADIPAIVASDHRPHTATIEL